jgi:hypothetical protein
LYYCCYSWYIRVNAAGDTASVDGDSGFLVTASTSGAGVVNTVASAFIVSVTGGNAVAQSTNAAATTVSTKTGVSSTGATGGDMVVNATTLTATVDVVLLVVL